MLSFDIELNCFSRKSQSCAKWLSFHIVSSALVRLGAGVPVKGLVVKRAALNWSLLPLCACLSSDGGCCCCWFSVSLAVDPLCWPLALSASVCSYSASCFFARYLSFERFWICFWHVASPRLVFCLSTNVF